MNRKRIVLIRNQLHLCLDYNKLFVGKEFKMTIESTDIFFVIHASLKKQLIKLRNYAKLTKTYLKSDFLEFFLIIWKSWWASVPKRWEVFGDGKKEEDARAVSAKIPVTFDDKATHAQKE